MKTYTYGGTSYNDYYKNRGKKLTFSNVPPVEQRANTNLTYTDVKTGNPVNAYSTNKDKTVSTDQGSYYPVASMKDGSTGLFRKPPVVTPTPKVEPKADVQQNFDQSYLDNVARNRRMQEESDFANTYNELINKTYNQQGQYLQGQIPEFEKRISEAERIRNERLSGIDTRLAQQSAQAQEQANMDTAQLGKIKKMQDVQRRNQFANLGTLESTGFFGFTGQQTNADQQFITDLANLEQEKSRVTENLRLQANEDRLTVQQAMDNEIAGYRSELNKLNNSVFTNEQDRQAAILGLQDQLRSRLYSIADSFDERETQRQKALQDIELEQKKLANDLEKERIKAGADSSTDTTAEALITAKELLASDLSAITGLSLGRLSTAIPGSAAQNTLNNYRKLQGLLQLANAKLLKGGGSISDAERALLAQASSSLGQNLSPADFEKNLREVARILEKDLIQSRGMNQTQMGNQPNVINIDGYIVEEL